jgi:hypothetical protein
MSHSGRTKGDRSYEIELRHVESPGNCLDVFGQAMKSHSFLRWLPGDPGTTRVESHHAEIPGQLEV